jgi:hypothetical protein
MNYHRQFWNQFCTTNNIATNKVPLFETSSGLAVKTKQIGKQPSGAFFVEALRWIILLVQAGVRVFNDMSVRQASQMIEGLKGSSAN